MSRQILESVVDECGRISVRISDEFTVLTSEEAEVVMAKFNCLQAENAKLRETLQRRNKQFEGMTEAWVERGVENAKLRELVRQMHPGAKAFLQMGVQLGCNDTLSYDWELQMRELGIEVDDV